LPISLLKICKNHARLKFAFLKNSEMDRYQVVSIYKKFRSTGIMTIFGNHIAIFR